MEEVLKKFGRYLLLDKIAQGGMAEIYRACPASMDGAGRLIVIKRIQQSFGGNNEFLQMFKAEIKVTMGFNHPNIVQVYDFGEEQQQPYIAMEFMDGKNLRQFISRTNEKKQPFPVELAVYIIGQAAAGLHYAHTYKDKISGESLNIIHRDISPQNILISYDGSVKVIDFGIAKASVNSEATRAGVIKGKPSYLSPEQIHGDKLDARCDIFALGAVLWELLVGRKLFSGENDLAILKMIESSQTHVKPPSAYRPEITRELDYIVLRALSKQTEKRYQSAEEFHRALHKFLISFAPDFNPSDLSYYAKDLFKDLIIEDRKHIQKLNDKAAQLLQSESQQRELVVQLSAPSVPLDEEVTRLANKGLAASGSREVKDNEALKGESVLIDKASSAGISASNLAVSNTSAKRQNFVRAANSTPKQKSSKIKDRKNGTTVVGVIAASLVALVFMGPSLGVKVPIFGSIIKSFVSEKSATLILEGNSPDAVVTIDGKEVAQGLPAMIPQLTSGKSMKILVKNAVGESFEQALSLNRGEKKYVAVIWSSPSNTTVAVVSNDNSNRTPASKVKLKINLIPGGGGSRILINGQPLSSAAPIALVPMDAPLDLTIEKTGYKTFRREFVLTSSQLAGQNEWPMDIILEPLQFGYLTIHTTPSADVILSMSGQIWNRKTPLENEKFPIGTYQARLVNADLGMEKTVTFSIAQNKVIKIDERLEVR